MMHAFMEVDGEKKEHILQVFYKILSYINSKKHILKNDNIFKIITKDTFLTK